MKMSMVVVAFPAGIINLSAQDRADVSLTGSVLSMNSVTNNNITRGGRAAGGVLGSLRFWAPPETDSNSTTGTRT